MNLLLLLLLLLLLFCMRTKKDGLKINTDTLIETHQRLKYNTNKIHIYQK